MQNQNNKYPIDYKFARQKIIKESPSVVVNSLKESHYRYQNIVLPQIEQSFIGLIKIFPEIPSLSVIFKVFIKFEIAMKFHIALEEEIIFNEYLFQTNLQKPINETTHEDEEPFLSEIINLIKKENCIHNPFCRILVQQLKRFDEELKHHAWIEENIIYKKIRENRMSY
jgi:hypothetical protein